MAVRVDYKNRMGYYYQYSEDKSKKWKIWLCGANAMWAQMYFYTDKDENGKRAQMVQLNGFLADVEHLKRCIKAGFLKYQGLTFFADKMTPELWKAVKELTQNGFKVTIK